MAVRSTKDTQIFISTMAAAPTDLTPTAISKAANAVVTVAAVTGIATGDYVEVTGTEFPELDGKSFAVGTVDGVGNTFELLGADTTASTATLDSDATSPPIVKHWAATSMQKVCLSSIGVNSEQPSTVSVATFCDPSASVPGATAGAGTLDFGGYLDTKAKGFILLNDAAEAGDEHTIVVAFPGDGGYLIGKGTISSFAFSDIPLDGAVAYTAQVSLSSKLRHSFERS